VVLSFSYNNEPKANEKDTLFFSEKGTMINGAIVRSKHWNRKAQLEVVTEKPGVDGNDNRKANIRITYIIGKKLFVIRKEVLFDGEEKFILRNEYRTSR
jgi:hypothetical protein